MRRFLAGLLVLLCLGLPASAAGADPVEVLKKADEVSAREGIRGMARVFQEAIAATTADGKADPALLPIYSLYSDILRALNYPGDALAIAASGFFLARAQPNPDPAIIANLAASRAFAMVKVSPLVAAITALQQAVELSDSAYGLVADQAWVRVELANRLNDARRYREAVGVRREVVAMREKGGEAADLLKARDALARALFTAEETAEAIAAYRIYLAELDRAKPGDHLDRAHALNDLAVALLREEANAEAASLLQDALRIVGPTREDKAEFGASVRTNLAAALSRLGEHKEARDAATSAMAIWKAAGSRTALSQARTFNLMVEIDVALGRHADALAASDQAMELTRGREADPSGIAIEALDARGMLLHAMQQYRPAERAQRSALAGWLALRSEDSPKVIVARQNLAGTLVELGAVDEPRALTAAALASVDRTLPEDSAIRGAVLTSRGRLLSSLGDFAASADAYAAALALWHARSPGTALEARALSNLAAAKINLGAIAEAEDLLWRALDAWLHTAPDHPDASFAEGNLIELLQRQGRLPEALALGKRFAEDSARRGPLLAAATARLTLATLHREAGNLQAVRANVERAIAIRRAELGGKHPAVAEAEGQLCLALWAERNIRDAQACAAANLDLTRAVFPAGHRAIGVALNNLAYFEAHGGRIAEGEGHYREAMTIAGATYGPSHPVTTIVAENLAAHLLDRVGRPAEALGLLRRAALNASTAALSEATGTIGAEKLLQRSRGLFGREVRAIWTVASSL